MSKNWLPLPWGLLAAVAGGQAPTRVVQGGWMFARPTLFPMFEILFFIFILFNVLPPWQNEEKRYKYRSVPNFSEENIWVPVKRKKVAP
jgi:hypothetical protein